MALTGAARLAPLPLRITAGVVLAHHGWQKLFGGQFEGFADMVRGFDLPGGDVLAHVAAWGEFAGGILLVLGLATRLAALVNCGTMAVAITMVHLANQPMPESLWTRLSGEGGYELPLVLLGSLLALLLAGGGALSLDAFFTRKPPADA